MGRNLAVDGKAMLAAAVEEHRSRKAILSAGLIPGVDRPAAGTPLEPKPEIRRWLDTARSRMSTLYERLDELLDAVGPVLAAPVPTTADAPGAIPSPCATELGQAIRDLSQDLETLAERIRNAVQRVEL